jgi:murein DD-endopeptidase MepM/ murein hydrolase activator NlpD
LLSILFFKSSPNSRDFSFLASVSQPTQDLFIEPAKNFIRESPDMIFIQNNSLVGVSPAATVDAQVLGSIVGGLEDGEIPAARKEIIEYIVEQGDTLSSLAAKYEISLETILWANELISKSMIKLGQKLIILPVSGIVYNIKEGDTLGEIVGKYKGKVSEIIDFNGLSSEEDIFIGDILIIPNGEMPKASNPTSYTYIPIGSSYFICPVPTCKITQGLHWYNATDFGAKCGDPIYAAAAGTVQRVSYGWNSGAGNYVTILHFNGVVTMYGHVSKSLVVSGQTVSQGDIIALIGGKPGMAGAGISTGCHVHFDVRGSRNPFAK